jgi:UDP-N-acetylglucosamine:LPS N-acetylglucosamine transferase
MISAKSGGGHDGTAQALACWIEKTWKGSVAWQCLDVYGGELRILPWLARIRHHTDRFWHAFFAIMEWPWALALARKVLARHLTNRVVRHISAPPDLLVATHFAGAQILAQVAARFAQRPATLIVATDYRPHRAWFAKADAVIVSAIPGLQRAYRFLPPGPLVIACPLLPSKPALPPSRQTDHTGRLRVLAVMGAEGTSGTRLCGLLRQLARQPWASRLDVQVICGRNSRLAKLLSESARSWGYSAEGTRDGPTLTVAGFVTDLPERLASAHLCLLRASPLVLTEVVAAGVPALAFDWHAHEEANASLLERWGCGRASRSCKEGIQILESWVRDASALDAVKAAALRTAQSAFGERETRKVLGLLQPRRVTT